MTLNIQKGNMYGFVTHTWNAIKGKCSHDCKYCYMKRFPQNPIRLDEKEFKTDLGKDNFIFVGSSTDMFAKDVPGEWIDKVINYCLKYPDNTYLFQSKNPERFLDFQSNLEQLPNLIIGTTIETNRLGFNYNAPEVWERGFYISKVDFAQRMVTIEPVMDFDVDILVNWIEDIDPSFINIGADSTKNNLSEPSKEKIKDFIKGLEKFTKVNLKTNIERLYKI